MEMCVYIFIKFYDLIYSNTMAIKHWKKIGESSFVLVKYVQMVFQERQL